MTSYRFHFLRFVLFLLIGTRVHGQTLPDTLTKQIAQMGATWEPKAACVQKANNQPPVTPAQIIALLQHAEVKGLLFNGAKMDLATAEAIASHGQHLDKLIISHHDVGALDYLQTFAKLKNLKHFMVGSSTFGDEGLATIATMSNLKNLTLSHVSQDPKRPITAKGLNALADGIPELEVLHINLHRMEPEMIPALARFRKLQELLVEWISPSFLAKVRGVLPNTKVSVRAGRYVREGFDPANFDAARDFTDENGVPLSSLPKKIKGKPTPPSGASKPGGAAVPPSAPAAVPAVEPLPPIDAAAMLDRMLNDPKTRADLDKGARQAWENPPSRTFPKPLRILLLSTAPVGPHLSVQNIPTLDEAALEKQRTMLATLSPEEVAVLSRNRTAGVRKKNLHTLGSAAMITLLREMDRIYDAISLTEITDERLVTRAMLAAHDVVFLNSVGQTDRPELFNEWLPDFVRSGGGLAANHGSVYLFVDEPGAEYNRLLGARLKYFPGAGAHPERGSGNYRVRLPQPDDPLVAAFRGREQEPMADELYNLVVDPRLPQPPRVLLEVEPENMIQVFAKDAGPFTRAVAWTQSYGKGKVFYLQTGHFPRALHQSRVATLLLDAIIHVASREKTGTSSEVPSLFPFWHNKREAPDGWLREHGFAARAFMKPPIDLTLDAAFADGKIADWIRHNRGGVVMMHFKEPATEADEDRALPELRRLASLAKEMNVQMVVYPYFGSHIDTAERALPFVKKLNCDNVGLTLHMPQEIKNGNGARIPEIIADVKEHIRLVVVCGADAPKPQDKVAEWEWSRLIRPLGDGDCDVRAFVQAVQASGYQGPYGFICWQFKEPTQAYLTRSMKAWNSYLTQ